jgi:DNA-binding transcriptional ArsR family regulator
MTYQKVLDALGDPTRRAILEHLRSGPQAVGMLARELPVSRPAVSQHLRVLKEAGLVSDRRVGTRRIYSLNPAGPAELRDYAERLWGVALERFKETAERTEGRANHPAVRPRVRRRG